MQKNNMTPLRHCKSKLFLSLGIWLGCFGPHTLAQDYPSRPIRVIVPFSAGGAVDGPMRVIAQELSKRFNQQVNVENRPGAGAMIGSEAVAKSPPDGYTIMYGTSGTHAANLALYKNVRYDPVTDVWTPISDIALCANVLETLTPFEFSVEGGEA